MYTPAGFTPLHVLPPALPDTTIVFAYREAKILITGSEEHPQPPCLAAIAAAGLAGPHHFLGLLAATPCIAITLPDDAPEPAGMRYAGLRSLFFRLPDPLLALAARAFQVIEWDRTHRYCGRCGTPTRNRSDERAKECPACGYIAYPRVSPAMMALITRGARNAAGQSAAFGDRHVQCAGGLRGTRRNDRGLRATRGTRGGRPRSRCDHLFWQASPGRFRTR